MFETSQLFILPLKFNSNINFIKSQIHGNAKLCAVVKGNAYGHGIETYIPMALNAGIKSFAVYCTDEAFRVKLLLPPDTHLMVMGDADGEALTWCIEQDVEFYVFGFERFNAAIQESRNQGKKARIHIEIETGMNRTGFSVDQLEQVIQLLIENSENLVFAGLCTHFAGAELNANLNRVNTQCEVFKSAINTFENNTLKPLMTHACCSAAMMKLPEMHFDLVRIGILLYGYWPSREMEIEYKVLNPEMPNPLKRIIQWQSRIMNIKTVPAGAWIGYGESYAASSEMRIAVIPIGYAHGYARALSNFGQVIIGGQKVPVLGTVNMNCISVDVTLIHSAEVGDDVIIIGKQDKAEISVASFSERSEQLNYELLTRLPASIPRKLKE